MKKKSTQALASGSTNTVSESSGCARQCTGDFLDNLLMPATESDGDGQALNATHFTQMASEVRAFR